MIEVKLQGKPIPVPLIYQPVYKLVILLAVLRYCTSKPYKAPLLSLHIFMWGVRSEENYKVVNSIAKKSRDTIAPWTFEPGLDKTIILGVVNKYCTREIVSNNLEIQLTKEGEEFLRQVEEIGVFEDDINKLKSIGIIPKSIIAKASTNWSLIEKDV